LKKQVVFLAVILGMVSLGVAIQPGSTVQVNNWTASDSSSSFNGFSNSTGTFLDTNVSDEPGNYNVSIDFSNGSTVYEEISIDEYSEWNFSEESVVTNASVLSGGSVNLSIESIGNSPVTLDLTNSGNLSELNFQVQSPVTVLPNTEKTVVNGFSVPRSQGFGWYNGTVTAKNGAVTDSVNVSVRIFDDIKPEIESRSFPDLMALQDGVFSVGASDNLEVANVNGGVWFSTTELQGNETVEVNRTLTEMDFNKTSTGNNWEYVLTDTDKEGKYYYQVTVSDDSNNSRNITGNFQINRLNSIQVLENDFEFKDMRPRTDDNPERQVEQKIFRKDFEKELVIGLTDFTHRKNNSSMTVGVKRLDDENLQVLYSDGEFRGNITVTETGDYELVVYSDSQGDTYSGDIKLYPVAQHEELENSGVIRFSGTVVDPEYPELPTNRSIGSFSGSLEFVENENGVATGIAFNGVTTDIDECKGVDTWNDCIPGYTLGELPEARSQVEKWKKQASDAVFWRNFFMVIGIGFPFFSVYNRFSQGNFMQEPRIPKQFVGQEVKDLNDVKMTRRDAAQSGGLLG